MIIHKSFYRIYVCHGHDSRSINAQDLKIKTIKTIPLVHVAVINKNSVLKALNIKL
jgi:hypothetical protein